jgi:arylsulfatase A-like enzyme
MRRLPRAAAIAAIAALAVASCAPAPATPRPNVVVLVMDTTRADRCSINGYARPTTPSLEAFAKDAVNFRQAWSPTGWTPPAHASLFTGLRPEHHGLLPGRNRFLDVVHTTLAERLFNAGYATACFTNNPNVSPESGLTRGFALSDLRYLDDSRPYPWSRATHEAALAWAVEQGRRGTPFFLFVNDLEPHLPYTPPAGDEAEMLRERPAPAVLADARAFGPPRTIAYCARAAELDDAYMRTLSDLYDAEIRALDREIGSLFDGLRNAGLWDHTMVVVVGDHGEMLGEHHQVAHQFSLYRAVRHVPMVVRWPGASDGGRVVDSVVRLEDLFPTVLEACGLPVPEDIDGASLAHGLEGRVARAIRGDATSTLSEAEKAFPGIDLEPMKARTDAVFDGRFHLIASADGRTELYDVTADPDESRNLAGERPADVQRLEALIPLDR